MPALRMIAVSALLLLCLLACRPTNPLTVTVRHENGLKLGYDDRYWEIATLDDGFVLKQKQILRSPRAATLRWVREGSIDQKIQTEPGGSGGNSHSIQAAKPCPKIGFVRLNASYQSEDPPDFSRELKLIEDAKCPESN